MKLTPTYYLEKYPDTVMKIRVLCINPFASCLQFCYTVVSFISYKYILTFFTNRRIAKIISFFKMNILH